MKGSVQKLHCTRASSKAHWTVHALRHSVRSSTRLLPRRQLFFSGDRHRASIHRWEQARRAGLHARISAHERRDVRTLADPLYDFVLQVTTGELREVEDMANGLRELFASHLG